MSQSDYGARVCMASRKLNLKFENLPLSVMYYGGGRDGGGGGGSGGGGGEGWGKVGVEFNKPAKKF